MPDVHFKVSRRIKEEFETAATTRYTTCRLPDNPRERPLANARSWHNERRFPG